MSYEKKPLITYSQYLKGVNKTWRKQDTLTDIFHCSLGIIGELGEIADWYKKNIGYGRPKDENWYAEVKGELGDVIYYIVKLGELAESNAIKDNFGVEADTSCNSIFPIITKAMEDAVGTISHSSFTVEFQNLLAETFLTVKAIAAFENIEFDDILISNLAKLEKRHGSSYNEKSSYEAGRNRDNELDALK
jgi:NTP pyrophosphatase (non-canonical NTP hydrolase)